MMKRRVPRKVKKWAKKSGWEISYFNSGEYYFCRTIARFNSGEYSYRTISRRDKGGKWIGVVR